MLSQRILEELFGWVHSYNKDHIERCIAMRNLLFRDCPCCKSNITVVQRVVALYDFSIHCKQCGCTMELSTTVIFVNMLISQFLAIVVMRVFFNGEKTLMYFFSLELWALLIFLPIITTMSFASKRL